MRRNTLRSLSHVRDFVASAFFAEEKGGAMRRETEGCSPSLPPSSLSLSLPQNARSVQNIIYLSSLIGLRGAACNAGDVRGSKNARYECAAV